MKIASKPFQLEFRRPFRIAHGVRTHTPVMFIELHWEGFVGYGEASMPPYLGEDHATAQRFINAASQLIERWDPQSKTEVMLEELDELSSGNTAIKAAIDIALHDLKGKISTLPCWRLLDVPEFSSNISTFTIGIDAPEQMAAKVAESGDFPILKVKLDGKNDRQIIASIRRVSDKVIAVDVNQGWKVKEDALEMICWLKEQGIILVEQPLPKNNIDDQAWLYDRSPLPIYGDESIQRLSDVVKYKDVFHGINIKLMKCTGLAEAKRMIDEARKNRLKVLLGCMTESSCAASAAAHLSSLADYCDLDGPMLITNDPFNGISFSKGRIIISESPGIGAIPGPLYLMR
jgi:L-alanine-DL-glutamate epimerase-like enolase superfamily enzyme